MINLMINGKPRELDKEVDLASYLNSFGLNLQHVAVGYNGEVLGKDQFDQIKLKEGDVLAGLEDEVEQARLRVSEAEVRSAEAALKAAVTQMADARACSA